MKVSYNDLQALKKQLMLSNQIPALITPQKGDSYIMYITESVPLYSSIEGYVLPSSLNPVDTSFYDQEYKSNYSSKFNPIEFSKKRDWTLLRVVPRSFQVLSEDCILTDKINAAIRLKKLGWQSIQVVPRDNKPYILNLLYEKLIEIPRELTEMLGKLEPIDCSCNSKTQVQNLIDPELAPNYYFNRQATCDRRKYAWYPTDVRRNRRKMQLLGPIHNLHYKNHKDLYLIIAKLLSISFGAFAAFDEEIQVVIKAEKYVVMPGDTINEPWHIEGVTENVQTVGLIICKDYGIPDNILFHYKSTILPYYTRVIPIKTGTSLLFPNNCVYRFQSTTNQGSEILEKIVLKFFLISNSNPLESTSFYYFAEKALEKMTGFPKIIIDNILGFLVSRVMLSEALDKKEIAKKEREKFATGWAFANFNNQEMIYFYDDLNQGKRTLVDFTIAAMAYKRIPAIVEILE